MTDYFALLEEPRQPWLDLAKLREKFHEKSRQAHPDAQTNASGAAESENAFTQLNEAYRALLDPKSRLRHLLELEGRAPNAGEGGIPGEIAAVFPRVAEATQAADLMRQRAAGATTALSRSLLGLEMKQVRARVDHALERLRVLEMEANAELRAANEIADNEERLARLPALYFRFAYLTRWLAELEEKRAQLALA